MPDKDNYADKLDQAEKERKNRSTEELMREKKMWKEVSSHAEKGGKQLTQEQQARNDATQRELNRRLDPKEKK
jgi:hypothetical protein